MSILINLKNLSLSFGNKLIFDKAELTINKGDQIGLIGLNGKGKSTLFKVIQNQVSVDHTTPPFIYDKSSETFEIFLIPQELNIKDYAHLTIENYYLAFYPELYETFTELEKDYSNQALLDKFESLQGWEIQNSYLSYLKGFDLKDHHRLIENLSGGEKRKMALSIGLSSKAEFLLWDEPTNHLDIETIEKFEDELLQSKKTYMIISHDRYLLNHITDKIVHIDNGKISTFKGKYLDYLVFLEDKAKELSKNLDKLQNKHRRELAWMRQGIKARGTRSKKRVEGFNNIKDNIKDIKSLAKKSVNLNLSHSGRRSKVLVQIEDGNFSYEEKEIFKDLNLIVQKSDKIALIGPNGAGKSTLIKIFSEKLALTKGKQKNAHELKVIVFDQHRESLDETKTPMEILGEGNDFVILGNGQQKHINSYLADFLFTSDQVHRPVATLSGGEKNRLQLAMFMRQSADLWVFDEPTNDLDIETIELLERELSSYDAAVIIIGHDRAFLDNICKSTWLINDKTIEAFEGGYTQVAPYLDALAIENQKSKNKKTKPSSKKEKTSLTYEEKKRAKTIEHDLENLEEKLTEIEKELSEFDFSKQDQGSRDQYQKLEAKKNELQKEINDTYVLWEKLQEI